MQFNEITRLASMHRPGTSQPSDRGYSSTNLCGHLRMSKFLRLLPFSLLSAALHKLQPSFGLTCPFELSYFYKRYAQLIPWNFWQNQGSQNLAELSSMFSFILLDFGLLSALAHSSNFYGIIEMTVSVS